MSRNSEVSLYLLPLRPEDRAALLGPDFAGGRPPMAHRSLMIRTREWYSEHKTCFAGWGPWRLGLPLGPDTSQALLLVHQGEVLPAAYLRAHQFFHDRHRALFPPKLPGRSDFWSMQVPTAVQAAYDLAEIGHTIGIWLREEDPLRVSEPEPESPPEDPGPSEDPVLEN